MEYRRDKLLAARSQLLTAIDLFHGEGDPISVHTLAGAAAEMLESLCRASGVAPFTDHVHASFPDKSLKDIWRIRNLYRNAFKHADGDDTDVMTQFDEQANDFLIYVAVEDYLRLRRKSPVSMQVFQVWFIAVHEDRLQPDINPTPFRTAFPGIGAHSRGTQKEALRRMIALKSEDTDLLAQPNTEALVLA